MTSGIGEETARPRKNLQSVGAIICRVCCERCAFAWHRCRCLHAVELRQRWASHMTNPQLMLATVYRTVYGVYQLLCCRTTGSKPADGTCAAGRRNRNGACHSGSGSDMESRTRSTLVPACTDCYGAALRVGRRQASGNADAAERGLVDVRGTGGHRMKTKESSTTKTSEPEKVDAYMKVLKHPLADVVEALRQIILNTDTEIGEEIKWNAPTFFYAGEMAPSDPKKYKRYLVVFNLFKKDCIRLVFPSGAKVDDGVRIAGGRLCRRSAAGDVFEHEGSESEEGRIAAGDSKVANAFR